MRPRAYIDASAAIIRIRREAESDALAASLDDFDLFGCDLLETELRRTALRWSLPQVEVTDVLNRITLVHLERADFRAAGTLAGPYLRSLDAIHLVAAARLNLDTIFTYDARMAEAARNLGMTSLSPSVE